MRRDASGEGSRRKSASASSQDGGVFLGAPFLTRHEYGQAIEKLKGLGRLFPADHDGTIPTQDDIAGRGRAEVLDHQIENRRRDPIDTDDDVGPRLLSPEPRCLDDLNPGEDGCRNRDDESSNRPGQQPC
jgi:hypothetical protein